MRCPCASVAGVRFAEWLGKCTLALALKEQRRTQRHAPARTRPEVLPPSTGSHLPLPWRRRGAPLAPSGFSFCLPAMSLRTLPLLVLNLGGEMLYIVDQRLRAQSIPGDKARQDEWTDVDRRRVMNDIIGGIFSKNFMDELFKPQELYSRKALRAVFERLVHASIMRLNAPSMDKLYDLMTMAFKYQVLLCLRPKDLLLITFNHLDAIKDFVYESPKILNQIDVTMRKFIDTYVLLSAGELQLIRQTLLIFFQDIHIRVSILLKDKVQNSNGHFVLPTSSSVPWGTEIPGLIRLFNNKGDEIQRIEFRSGGNYVLPYREGSFNLHGDRVIRLGTNIYSISRPVETDVSGATKNLTSRVKLLEILLSMQENTAPNPLAKEELNLLARLMGGLEIKKPLVKEAGFRLNLFTTDEEEEHAALTRPEELSYQVLNIHADQDQQRNEELDRIMGEFEMSEQHSETNSKECDLLAMMDKL